MKLLANPLVLRMLILLGGMGFVCFMAFFTIRHMRRSLVDGSSAITETGSSESFPLHTYHAVIQQLKQQKYEIQNLQQAERRRAKTSENISSAVLSNLSIGVMFFAGNGLIRQANPAAREILGFASPLGMSAAEIFSRTTPLPYASESLPQAIQDCLRESVPSVNRESEHTTPGGEVRRLRITVTPVRSADGEVLGAACLIDDKSEVAEIRKQQELRGEISAEMALELRNSLATISGYGRQLAVSRDPELARQLATDIAAEASHLDHTIGGFLAGARSASAAASGA